MGPQARWYRHAFGPRNYPLIHLDIDIAVRKSAEHSGIVLSCHYGDPMCWQHLIPFLQQYGERVIMHTYGTFDTKSILKVLDTGCRFCFDLDGTRKNTGKVYLGAEWDTIDKNIQAVGTRLIQCDLLATVDYEQERDYLESRGINVYKKELPDRVAPTPIVNQHAQWIHDVYPEGYSYEMPVRSIRSYNTLRTLMNPPKGRSILDQPLVPPGVVEMRTNTPQDTYVCPTGHVFDSEKAMYFMYMLGDDWDCFDKRIPDDVIRYAQILKQEL